MWGEQRGAGGQCCPPGSSVSRPAGWGALATLARPARRPGPARTLQPEIPESPVRWKTWKGPRERGWCPRSPPPLLTHHQEFVLTIGANSGSSSTCRTHGCATCSRTHYPTLTLAVCSVLPPQWPMAPPYHPSFVSQPEGDPRGSPPAPWGTQGCGTHGAQHGGGAPWALGEPGQEGREGAGKGTLSLQTPEPYPSLVALVPSSDLDFFLSFRRLSRPCEERGSVGAA